MPAAAILRIESICFGGIFGGSARNQSSSGEEFTFRVFSPDRSNPRFGSVTGNSCPASKILLFACLSAILKEAAFVDMVRASNFVPLNFIGGPFFVMLNPKRLATANLYLNRLKKCNTYFSFLFLAELTSFLRSMMASAGVSDLIFPLSSVATPSGSSLKSEQAGRVSFTFGRFDCWKPLGQIDGGMPKQSPFGEP